MLLYSPLSRRCTNVITNLSQNGHNLVNKCREPLQLNSHQSAVKQGKFPIFYMYQQVAQMVLFSRFWSGILFPSLNPRLIHSANVHTCSTQWNCIGLISDTSLDQLRDKEYIQVLVCSWCKIYSSVTDKN